MPVRSDTRHPALRLKRIASGRYQTLDGRYEILKDPHSGDEPGGWGTVWWLTFDNELGSQMGHIFEPVGTLFEARLELAALIARRTVR